MTPKVTLGLVALLVLAPAASGRAPKAPHPEGAQGNLRSGVARPATHGTAATSTVAAASVRKTVVAGHPLGGRAAGAGKLKLLQVSQQKAPQQKAPLEQPRPEYVLRRMAPGLEVVFGVATCAAILFVLVLTACCIYDGIAHWRHMAYFRHCCSYVQRVHDVFSAKPDCATPLCPVCIEKVSTEACSDSVVFLCGHRFHTECANSWYLDRPRKGVRCPICNVCEEAEGLKAEDEATHDEAEAPCDLAPEFGTGLRCEAGAKFDTKAFFLRSLKERFPEFISEDCVRRWAGCHTEIWLAELDCPSYPSMFASVLARVSVFTRRK